MSKERTNRNPASRLHELLNIARQQAGTESTRKAWCVVFDIDNPNHEQSLFRVLEYLVALRKLFREVENLLRQIPTVNESLFIEPIVRMSKVVNLNGLHLHWSNYLQLISTEDMHSLIYCEDLLSRHPELEENEIPPNDIQEILNELNSLYESITASALPENLKTVLLNLIRDMWNSIHEYRVRGASALHDALEKSVGVLAINREIVEENSTSEEVQTLGRMLIKIDKLYTFAKKAKPLLEAAGNILPDIMTRLLRP